MHYKVERQQKKSKFHDKMAYEWDLQRSGEMVLGLVDFNEHVENILMVLRVCMVEVALKYRRMLPKFLIKKNCVLQIHGFTKRKEEN